MKTQNKRSLLSLLLNSAVIGLTFYNLYNQKYIERIVAKLDTYNDMLNEEVQRIENNFKNHILIFQDFIVGVGDFIVGITIRDIQK